MKGGCNVRRGPESVKDDNFKKEFSDVEKEKGMEIRERIQEMRHGDHP
jgi:hypothetical protein